MVNEIREDYVALGEGKGMKIKLYPNRLVIQRIEKEEGKWKTTQEITLGLRVIEYLAARLPAWITLMEANKKS